MALLQLPQCITPVSSNVPTQCYGRDAETAFVTGLKFGPLIWAHTPFPKHGSLHMLLGIHWVHKDTRRRAHTEGPWGLELQGPCSGVQLPYARSRLMPRGNSANNRVVSGNGSAKQECKCLSSLEEGEAYVCVLFRLYLISVAHL